MGYGTKWIVRCALFCVLAMEPMDLDFADQFVNLLATAYQYDIAAVMEKIDSKNHDRVITQADQIHERMLAALLPVNSHELSNSEMKTLYHMYLKQACRSVRHLGGALNNAQMVIRSHQGSLAHETVYTRLGTEPGVAVVTTCTREMQKKLLDIFVQYPTVFADIVARVHERRDRDEYTKGYTQALHDTIKWVSVAGIVCVTVCTLR